MFVVSLERKRGREDLIGFYKSWILHVTAAATVSLHADDNARGGINIDSFAWNWMEKLEDEAEDFSNLRLNINL
jgi:hypothetical protein